MKHAHAANLTRLARYLTTAMVAVAPAAAIAAEPAAAPGTKGAKLGAPVVLSKSAAFAKQAAKHERKQRRAERRARRAPAKVHPVAGKVSYGDAMAAFGHARGRPHNGQDIFAPAGTKLVAVTDGVVLESGSDGGRGNWVSIYDPKRDQTYVYFHMLGPATVGAGEKLKAGEKVGEVGCSGSCWGDHLHFELREGRDSNGAAHDPMPFLADAERG